MPISNRQLLLAISIMCIFALAYSFYAQYYQGQLPCPLCIVQRVMLLFIGIFSIAATIFNARKISRRIIALINTSLAIFASKIAYQHVLLQNLPPEQQPTSCGMPLDIMYQQLPLHNFIKYILAGDGECAKITWRILGVSAPQASLSLFLLLGVINLWLLFRAN